MALIRGLGLFRTNWVAGVGAGRVIFTSPCIRTFKAQARQIVDGGQVSLEFGFELAVTPLRETGSVDIPLPVSWQSSGYLLDRVDDWYQNLEIDVAVDHDRLEV